MKRIIVGVVLIAGGIAWDIVDSHGAIVILHILMVVCGFVLFALGMRHEWISRR